MWGKRALILSGLLLFWLAILASSGGATKPMSTSFWVKMETLPPDAKAGAVTLRMVVTPVMRHMPWRECKEVSVVITKVDNLVYTGPDSTAIPMGSDTSVTFEFPIVIPADDTSGMEFHILGGGAVALDAFYWVTKPDKVKTYRGNVRSYPSARMAGQVQRIDSSGHMLDVEAAKYPRERRGQVDEHGNPVSQEKIDSLLKEIERKKNQPIVNPPLVPDTTYMLMKTDSGNIVVKKSDYLPNR